MHAFGQTNNANGLKPKPCRQRSRHVTVGQRVNCACKLKIYLKLIEGHKMIVNKNTHFKISLPLTPKTVKHRPMHYFFKISISIYHFVTDVKVRLALGQTHNANGLKPKPCRQRSRHVTVGQRVKCACINMKKLFETD
jgi:ferredoxin-thioredoxin reductase catalytic subunit